jgi:hypothetical protein
MAIEKGLYAAPNGLDDIEDAEVVPVLDVEMALMVEDPLSLSWMMVV